jgi:ABC-type uncharacterized transport system substrate-binding protein
MSKSAKSHHPNQRALRRTASLDAVAAAIARADVGALCVGDGPTLMSGRAEITAMVARLRLPAMYGFREFADAGGLMSYGYGLPDAYRQSARLVVRILKGDRPGDLPFHRGNLTSFHLGTVTRRPQLKINRVRTH